MILNILHKYDELFTDLMNTIFEKKAEQKG